MSLINHTTDFINNAGGMLTSYGLALLGMFSTDDLMVFLGAILLIVRLLYESIRLVRYIKSPEGGDDG